MLDTVLRAYEQIQRISTISCKASQHDAAGTRSASPMIDSSSAIADQLFAPFPEDLFSTELDIQALRKMLTQPLTTRVPVASGIFTQYCSLMPTLYCPSNTEHARELITRFDYALGQSWSEGFGSAVNYISFWDILGFRLPEFAQQHTDCGASCSRGIEVESMTLPKGRRDYVCLVDNMLVAAGVHKASRSQMTEADTDLIKQHVISNRAMFGRLQYIILIGTAGSDLKFNVMSITPGSGLQELFPAMEVISPLNRQKALLMFVNLVRWLRTVHDQHVLPLHKHQLFKNRTRPSPYPELIGCPFDHVTLNLNYVKKSMVVPFSYLSTMVETYRMIASGAIPGACQVDKMEVDGAVVDLLARRRKLAVSPGDVGIVTLILRPVGMHQYIDNSSQLVNLIKQLLATLTALHKQQWVHRDVRMDNVVQGPTGWILIDWELAAPAGQHVFWNSTYLPPEVNAAQMPYTAACDLWQVGRIIQQHTDLSSEAMKHFANQLTSKHFECAQHALHAMPEL